jgi:hypothetical protein
MVLLLPPATLAPRAPIRTKPKTKDHAAWPPVTWNFDPNEVARLKHYFFLIHKLFPTIFTRLTQAISPSQVKAKESANFLPDN